MPRSAKLLFPLAMLGFACLILLSVPRSSAVASLTTTLVSRGDVGQLGNAGSLNPAISADGSIVAFQSDATNLVSADNNGKKDIFVVDRNSNAIRRVSITGGGFEANDDSSNATVSGDGRFVAFQSRATDLVPNDTNNATDVFVYDLTSGAIERVSLQSNGLQANASSFDPVLSYDGRYVAFWSIASNLATNDTNSSADVFVHDRDTNATFRVSVAGNGQQGDDDSSRPSISDDGRYVAFESYASNLIANDLNTNKDIFVHDWQGLSTDRVSRRSDGGVPQGDSYNAVISRNGDHVAFTSIAANLVDNDTNDQADVFLHTRSNGNLQRISISDGEAQSNANSDVAGLTGGGRYIVFTSSATNLVSGDTNNTDDVFLRDTQAGTTTRASVTNDEGQANGISTNGNVAVGGELIVFDSTATNLVNGDSNGVHDVFARDLSLPPPTPTPSPTPVPLLTVNHNVGQPGSSFLLTANNFQGNTLVNVTVNGVSVGNFTAPASSTFDFEICSQGLSQEGVYVVTVISGSLAASAVFRLDAASNDLWPPTGATPSLCVPGNVAYEQDQFMPLARDK